MLISTWSTLWWRRRTWKNWIWLIVKICFLVFWVSIPATNHINDISTYVSIFCHVSSKCHDRWRVVMLCIKMVALIVTCHVPRVYQRIRDEKDGWVLVFPSDFNDQKYFWARDGEGTFGQTQNQIWMSFHVLCFETKLGLDCGCKLSVSWFSPVICSFTFFQQKIQGF